MDPSARVIIISADIQTSSRELVREAGATGFLNKPVDAEQVLGAVGKALAGASDTWS
jgi:DNA-binding NarL/FixJ family response regulator